MKGREIKGDKTVFEKNNLPKGWALFTFNDHLILHYGKGLLKNQRKVNSSVPVYGSSGINGYCIEALTNEPCVVIGRKGSAGEVYYVNEPCWAIDTTYFLLKNPVYALKFFYYFFKYVKNKLIDSSTTIPSLRRDDVYTLQMILPPLNEQKRIVSKIESIFAQIDAERKSLDNAKVLLKQCRQSVLKSAFEGKLVPQDPNDEPAEVFLRKMHKNSKKELVFEKESLPKGWTKTTIGYIYDLVGGGTPSTKIRKYWKGDISWISSADIHGLYDIRPRRKITPEAIKNSATNLVPAGSIIVVTRVGLGKIARTKTPLCFSQDSQALIENVSFTHPDYVLYYLSQTVQLFKHTSRGTTISGVTKKQLSQLTLPLPPTNEQKRIVSKIESIFGRIDSTGKSLDAALSKMDLLKKSVLRRAFEGKLVPQDPNDEPASALLERIKKEKTKLEQGESVERRKRNGK